MLLLAEWSTTTTLTEWLTYSSEIQRRTTTAAKRLPYKDTPRSRWESGKVAPDYTKTSRYVLLGEVKTMLIEAGLYAMVRPITRKALEIAGDDDQKYMGSVKSQIAECKASKNRN